MNKAINKQEKFIKYDHNFDKKLIEYLKARHDEPVFINDKGNIIGINRMFFADLISETQELIFESDEQKLYLYNDSNGLWEQQTQSQITSLISSIFSGFCRETKRPDAIGKCNGGMIKDIKELLTGLVEEKVFFKPHKNIFIHCANGVLVYEENKKEWNLKPFSKKFRSRNRTEFIYEPKAECPQFLNRLILKAMSKEDANLLQFYMGQCIMAHNHDQSLLLMTGTPGGGKSTTVNILESIIGDFNVTELRLEHMGSRFELQRLIGKSLLTGKDVRSNFLNTAGASKLKALVGNDPLTTETKGQNNVSKIRGNFNAIITANNNLKVTLDGDKEAWSRRILWIKYDQEPPDEVITDFDIQLLESEGSGILNWALEGVTKLMKNNKKIPRDEKQKKRINDLLEESDSVNVFVRECTESDSGKDVTGHELLMAFAKYCRSRNWEILPDRVFQKDIRTAMLKYRHADKRNDIKRKGKSQRGYSKVKLNSISAI